MKDTIVSISESAFFTMTTTALEAYRIEHITANGSKSDRVETFGHLWGYMSKSSAGMVDIYRVVWADTSTAVIRDTSSVACDPEAMPLKESFLGCFFPEVEYLGDYHSHPYDSVNDGVKSELEVQRKELYKFSDADFRAVRNIQKEDMAKYRVGLVVTIYERGDQRPRSMELLDEESCIRFQYENTTIWIKAYVWKENKKDFGFRKRPDKSVKLVCPTLGVNRN
jgi:hypothetical protein